MSDENQTPIDTASIPHRGKACRLQFEQAQDCWVLLYPEGMVKLNPSAAEILQRCDGQRSIAEVTAELESAFGEADLSADVLGFVDIALKQKWITLGASA